MSHENGGDRMNVAWVAEILAANLVYRCSDGSTWKYVEQQNRRSFFKSGKGPKMLAL